MTPRQPFFSNLQPKVLAAVSGTCCVLFLGQLGLARSVILRGYAHLEQEQAQTNAERLQQTFAWDIENLTALLRDWAVWDDTYEFVQTGDPDYVESNLTSDTFSSLSLNLIAIFDTDGQLIYGRFFNRETGEQIEIPPDVLTALVEHPAILHRSLESPQIAGFVQLHQKPMVLASQAIMTSNNEGPVQGSFVMGHYFGEPQLAELAETTRLPVASFILNADPEQWPSDVRAIAPDLIQQSGSTAVQVLNPEQIAAYALIPDLVGEPALILKTNSDREIYARGQISLHYYFWSSLMIGIGFCLLILLLLRSLVLARLESLSQQVSHIGAADLGTGHAKPVQVILAGQDEIAQLASRINWTLQQLHQQTAELQAAKQIAEVAKDAADSANRAKSSFLANMSHELRTPLNAILGFAQILGRDRSLTADQRENISIINRSGEHLLSLINDVLDMSKIEAEHIELNASSFDLFYLLETLEDMLQLKAESKGLELKFEVADTVPQFLYGDSRKLRQVLINLLNNAIKFTTDGSVKLAVTRLDAAPMPLSPGQPTHVQFTVEDTGIGIAEAELPLVFEPFVQTESGRQSQQGTGLGLSISRKFIELMGGKITVDSEIGQGSTFTCDIWAVIADDHTPEADAPGQMVVGLEPGQPSYRILVVDDRPLNRKLLIDLLTPVGFELRAAENGQVAVELWETWQPHLIWMDMRMPVMNGYEATQRIKSQIRGQATTIIALTASTLEEEKAIVLSAGCDDFVRKPFQQDIIFTKMAEYLGVRYRYAENAAAVVVSCESSKGSDRCESCGSSGSCDRCDRNSTLSTPSTLSISSTLSNPSSSTIHARLAQMSPDWLQQLRRAAMQLNGPAIDHLISQLPPAEQDCLLLLRAKVDNFDFDHLLTLADRALYVHLLNSVTDAAMTSSSSIFQPSEKDRDVSPPEAEKHPYPPPA